MALADADRAATALVDVLSSGWSERRERDRLEVVAWVPSRARSDALAAVEAALSSVGVPARVIAEAEGDEWRDGLVRQHRPIDVGGRLRVRPPWTDPVPGWLDVVIDPGMAFGTGQHATTRGCLECLLDVPPATLVDVGCGSGVLAIAARKLGHDPVIAIDNDPLCVEATRRNAAVNDAELDVRLVDATSARIPDADVIVANITRLHVIELAERVGRPPRTAILSGFLGEDASRAIAPWLAMGLRVDRTAGDDVWAVVRLERE